VRFFSSTAEQLLEECSRARRSIYELSKKLKKHRYTVAVQCKKLENDGFLSSQRETRVRKYHYYSLGVRGLCYFFLKEANVDRLVDIAKSNVALLPELFGSQFFVRHPSDICQVLRSAILETGIFGGPLIPKERQDVYYRFVHFLAIDLLDKSHDDSLSSLNHDSLLAEVLSERIAAWWWPIEARILLVYLARFWQRAEKFVEFQDKIAQASRATKMDFAELTTIATLTKQLPDGFRELLAQKLGVNWEKRNYGYPDIIPPELLPDTLSSRAR